MWFSCANKVLTAVKDITKTMNMLVIRLFLFI